MSRPAFFLIVIDEDRNQFTVEGPMCDDRPWNRAVANAQTEGRRIKCCNGGTVSRADAVAQWQRHYGHLYRFVKSGTIVLPQSK
jgi:hypothetical protein